jgi:hypothetical protein
MYPSRATRPGGSAHADAATINDAAAAQISAAIRLAFRGRFI